jgi:hypothetical protein
MNAMRCENFYEALDQWMEGQRPTEAQRHVAECVVCRGLVADLDAIASTAPSLAAADAAPPERLWNSLRSAMEKEGLIAGVHPSWAARLGSWIEDVFVVVPRPAMAGAYLAAILAVSLAVVGPLRQHFGEGMAGVAAVAAPLNAQLDTDEQAAVASLGDSSPAVTASLQTNLALVDNHIALCEKSLSEDPTSEAVRDYLYEAYQQKAELLAEISERGALGR